MPIVNYLSMSYLNMTFIKLDFHYIIIILSEMNGY